MACSGENLDVTSCKDWPQVMTSERLLITTNNNSSCTGTNANKNKMIPADSAAASSNDSRVMNKPSSAQDRALQEALRCPRCDSSNTKFCYYNNYSLSQPRHFCKACKRYWTRGGTLRNVPVGGGFRRKNKRPKKPAAAASSSMAPPPGHPLPCPLLPPDPVDSLAVQRSSSSHLDAAALYALQTAASSSDMSLELPILANGIQIPSCSTTAFDLQAHLVSLGLGMSSNPQRDNEYHLGELQPLPSVSSTAMSLLNDYPLFGSSLQSASLLQSSIRQQPKQVEDYQTLLAFDELHASAGSESINGMMKKEKLEGETNNMMNSNISSCIDWQIPSENSLNNFGPGAAMYWNSAIGDGSNFGSSLTPLI